MPSTYSTNLGIELITTGEQAGTWGATTNTNLGTLIEQAISGYVAQVITDGADTVITIPSGSTGVARNMTLELTGTLTAARNLVVPSNRKLYFIYNNTTGGFAVTVKVSGQTGVSVPNGAKVLLVSNGTDVVNAVNYIPALYFSAGTAAAPSISTIGDTNTGIYFPAADTLAFSEGGVEAMRIDSGGNIGINTVPSAWATTTSNIQGIAYAISGYTSGSNIQSIFSNNSYLAASGWVYRSSAGAGQYLIASNEHRWQVAASGGAGNPITFSQAMTLNSSGNLSLGTAGSDGSRVYSYADTAAPFVGFAVTNASLDTTSSADIKMVTPGGQWKIRNIRDGGALTFYGPADTELVRISSTGNLGIGTSSPGQRLDILTPAANAAAITIRANNATNTSELYIGQDNNNAAYVANRANQPLILYTNNLERARISPLGYFGIGVTTPSTVLHVRQDTTAIGDPALASGEVARFQRNAVQNSPASISIISGNTNNAALNLGDSDSAAMGRVLYDHSVNALALYSNGSERVRIDITGRVGIGTTSPQGSMEVMNGANFYLRDFKSAATITSARLLFGTFNANPLTALYGYSDSATNNIVAVGGGTSVAEPATRLVFYTGAAGTLATGTERMRIDVDGNVGIGTSSPSSRLHVEGGGVVIKLKTTGAIGSGSAAYINFDDSVGDSGYVGFGGTANTFDIYNRKNGAMTFATNNTERARITSDGNFLIGTANTSTLGTNTKLKTGPATSFGGITANVTTAVDTGISINQSTCGGCIVLIASRNTGTGLATEAAVYIVRFYYDGNNAPTTVYVGGSSNFVTFGTSASNTLTVTNASGGNANYSWFGNK